MDQNKKNPNTANDLLQRLKQNIALNDSDKESIAAEEAAAKKSQGTRYKFRVMKRDEYLEKKRIADALAAAADDADISDDDLEALLRNYLKKTPTIDPIVEEIPEETPASSAVIDLDKPLSPQETPFFEDAPIESEVEPADEISEDVLDEISDDDLDLLLDLLPEDEPETVIEPDVTDAVLSDETETADPMDEQTDSSTEPQASDEQFTILFPATSDEKKKEKAPVGNTSSFLIIDGITEEAAPVASAEDAEDIEDDDFAALLASIPEDGEDDAYITEPEQPQEAEPALADTDDDGLLSADDVTDAELEAMLADIDTELAQENAVESEILSDEVLPAEEESEAMLSAIEEDIPQTKAASNAVTDAELEAMLAAIESEDAVSEMTSAQELTEEEPISAEDTDLLSDDMLLDALAELVDDVPAELSEDPDVPQDSTEDNTAVDTAPADTEASASDDKTNAGETDAGEFDQTDLDLMIAFGMEDQLENAVGHERAKKYKKAIGDRSDDHYNEMHSGDRPDTVQDKHAEYVSAAQNREIFAEYKKKYSGMLFRFLGALFFLILLFFFENDRLLGITMPAIFDREQYPLVYTLFDLQLVLLSGAMVWRGIRTGIRAIFRGRPIPESITGFLFLACLVYTVVIAALCPMHGLQLYNFPIGLAVLFELCYEFMNLRREIMSFKIVSSKKLKYAVDAIAPKDGEAERKMFAEYISDDPALFRIKRTAFVESFFARTETYPRTQRILRAVLPAVFLMILAFFAAKFILTGNVYEALTVSYITMLLTLPSCAFIAFSYPMYRASGFAYEKDSAMIGEASLGEYADASVVSFDDKEVFPARGVRVRNVKVYGENRIDHVIYAAASVFHVVGGPLAEVFETATGELGYAENVKLTRLDRDGIEARVDGGTVLIGRAAFINRYGYSVALNESEKSMEETGDASILYIAYDNNVAAKLYIQYSVEPDFEIVLKQLYRQGVCVGIKTSDPNIDDHLLSCKIKMSKYPVKIIKCAEPKETAIIVDRLSSGIVSKSSAKALLQTLAICDRVLSASRTNNVLGVVSILLGMAAMAFCVISGMAVTLAPVWIALYQLFWIIPVIAISRYYI